LPENVYGVAACTSCRGDLFASHRREGDAAGRMMAIASIEEEPRTRPEGDG
jgi:copper oxidase (laccase) domain-containing protein